jgi:hypothetical protein
VTFQPRSPRDMSKTAPMVRNNITSSITEPPCIPCHSVTYIYETSAQQPYNYTHTDVADVDRELSILVYVPAGGWDAPARDHRAV